MLSDTLAACTERFLPIGLRLTHAARVVERAFDEALGEAGGTLPVWLILLNLKIRRPANQRELAEAVGVREATLTHHLNAMDASGLVTRTRDAANRRVQVVALTEAAKRPSCASGTPRSPSMPGCGRVSPDGPCALLGLLANVGASGKPPRRGLVPPTAAGSRRAGARGMTRRSIPYVRA